MGFRIVREEGRDRDLKAGAAQRSKIFRTQRGITQSLLILLPSKRLTCWL